MNYSDLITERLQTPELQIERIQRLMGEIEHDLTQRPLIVYAADFAKSHPLVPNLIYLLDKTIFADLLDSVGTSDSVDVMIQSPGGFVDATEQLVNMLRVRFRSVNFYVPHTAKSAATMMVCAGDKVFMDHRSELGPIDPQVQIPKTRELSINVPAQAYLDGFDRIRRIVEREGTLSPAFLPVLNQVDASLLQICEDAGNHSKRLVETWLTTYMLADDPEREPKAHAIAETLGNYRELLTHGRPLGLRDAQQLGLNAIDLSLQPDLQRRIWELYCRIELLFDGGPWVKIFVSKSFMVGKLIPAGRPMESPAPVQHEAPTDISNRGHKQSPRASQRRKRR